MSPSLQEQRTDDMTALCLRSINAGLIEAASVAKVALVFAENGARNRALQTALDIEERDSRRQNLV